jgi:hypothetical protein
MYNKYKKIIPIHYNSSKNITYNNTQGKTHTTHKIFVFCSKCNTKLCIEYQGHNNLLDRFICCNNTL